VRNVARISLLLALLGAASARADSVCEQGFRDTTPEERATVVRVLEAAKAALPAAPEGWVIGGYEQISARGTICRDAETTPWSYNVSRTYNRADNVAERERALAEQGAAMRASMAEKQPRMDALMARSQALGGELATAAEAGDQARVDAINAELETLSKQFESLMNEGDPQAQAEAVAAALRDVEMSIAVAVNPGPSGNADMKPMAPPAGAKQAFRWETTSDGVARAHVLVRLESAGQGDAPPAAAHAISVRAEADPARIDALVAGIDFAALAALLR
jgi:hypothetical protein